MSALKIGGAAVVALALMVVGLLLYGVADLRLGGWVALAGLVLAMASTLAARIWIRTHDDDG